MPPQEGPRPQWAKKEAFGLHRLPLYLATGQTPFQSRYNFVTQNHPTLLKGIQLFLLGFLTLFLELALIRYLSGNIWNLGYFPNLVLLATFLGMGIGFVFYNRVSDEKSPFYFTGAAVVLLLLLLLVYGLGPSLPGFGQWGGEIGGELYFTHTQESSGFFSYLSFAFWFLGTMSCFALISQRTARLFQQFPPLHAYTLDIVGSCCGILAFAGLSWLQWPSASWFALFALLFLAAHSFSSRGNLIASGLLLLLVVGVTNQQDRELLGKEKYKGRFAIKWSPYQKIEYLPLGRHGQWLFANGIGHQVMYAAGQLARNPTYMTPYVNRQKKKLGNLDRVLVIGAGSGNDVAVALAFGAKHVDALEIDPVLAAMGKKYHPAKPYQDKRVSLHIGDARTFLNHTKHRYDLIMFALTDSLVKVSAMAQLRLENYVYTKDSVKQAFGLLKPKGELVLYNSYRQLWLMQKLYWTLAFATKRKPRVYDCSVANCFLHVGPSDPKLKDGTLPRALLKKHAKQTKTKIKQISLENMKPSSPELQRILPSDDWPFLYLKNRHIPIFYLIALGALLLLVMGLLWLHQRLSQQEEQGVLAPGLLPLKLAFLLMGTAFLLLETKSIIQFSLLFGTTWVNTSMVFFGILVLVILANWTASLLPKKSLVPLYVLLLLSCFVPFLYPLSNLLSISSPFARLFAASLLTFSPIFFANLIFSLTFRDQKVAAHLFGWNLLGSTLGGLIEYTSMLFGYQFLAVLVAICYTVVFCLILYAQSLSAKPEEAEKAEAATA